MNAFKRHAGFTRHWARRAVALAKSQRDLEFITYGKQEY